MAVMLKDIRLKPVIGNWYEYKPRERYTNYFETANLSAEQVNELLEVHHKWADYFGQLLALNLKISCGVQETAVTKTEYASLDNHVPSTSVSFEVTTDKYSFAVIFDNVLAYALLDRACGGQGLPLKKLNEELTVAEKAVFGVFGTELLKSYRAYLLEAFPSAQPGEIFSPKMKPEIRFKKDDSMVVFTNTFYLADNKPGTVSFVYPEKYLEKLHEAYALKKDIRPKKLTVQLSPDSITDVKVPVNIRIGTTKVTINDIMGVAVGDILQLNEKITDSLVMSIAEQGEFFVKLGSRAGNYAVKILDFKPKNSTIPAPQVTVNTVSRKVESSPADVAVEPSADAAGSTARAELDALGKPPVSEPEVSALPEEYNIETPSVEDTPEVLNNEPMTETLDSAIETPPPVINEESVAYTADGKVDSEKLEIKDPLLDELGATETAVEDNDEFTWDIDDLK